MNKRLSESSIPKKNDKDSDDSDAQERRTDRQTGKRAGRGAKNAKNNDKALVKRAQNGDAEAFRVLFERYHRRAYSLALGVVRNPDDALDVVQEGFIKAHRYLDRFKGTSSFYTWLYRIVMNLSIDHLRKHKRNRHVDWTDAIGGDNDNAVGDESLLPRILGQHPGKEIIRKEIRGQISKALGELSENHRAVIVMREIDGLSYAEMAEAMGCSKGTIMSRLFHARKNMQLLLHDYVKGIKDHDANHDANNDASNELIAESNS